MRTQFYIFRHGQTDWNKEGRLQGHSDIPLNETGCTQAQGLFDKFQNIQVDYIYSSDLSRALETAKFAFGRDAKIHLSKNLREISCGDYEGIHRDSLGEDIISKILSGAPFVFPGGESTALHFERIKNELLNIEQKHKGASIAISTHGGSMVRILESCPTFTNVYIDNCALALVSTDGLNFEFHHFL